MLSWGKKKQKKGSKTRVKWYLKPPSHHRIWVKWSQKYVDDPSLEWSAEKQRKYKIFPFLQKNNEFSFRQFHWGANKAQNQEVAARENRVSLAEFPRRRAVWVAKKSQNRPSPRLQGMDTYNKGRIRNMGDLQL